MTDHNIAPDPALLAGIGEYFAAGYFEEPGSSPVVRWSRALRRRLENEKPAPYDGGLLYPCGPRHLAQQGQNRILRYSYTYTWSYNEGAADAYMDGASRELRATLKSLCGVMREETKRNRVFTTRHTVGGMGYTHGVPNYGRVIREGLNRHADRIAAGLAAAKDNDRPGKADFYHGMQDVVAGIRRWHGNMLEYLEGWRGANAVQEQNRERIATALKRVPFFPAETFFEAILAYNLVYYLDECDNPGRIDQELIPYYGRDIAAGGLTREHALELVRAFVENVCANDGYSAAIGGTAADGTPGYNEVTLLCLEAARNRYRPSWQLRVRNDMPDKVWDAALNAIASGSGNPALYSEEGFMDGLRESHLGLSEEDLTWWNGGGCTETMIHGRSNVGSLDAGIHLPLVLEKTLGKSLPRASSFDGLVKSFKRNITGTVREIVDNVSLDQRTKAERRPAPMRSLLIDDCVERGIEYNAGGARYNWSVVNVAGLTNVADSLAAVRDIVFEKKEKSGPELLEILRKNFEGEETFRRRLERCPRFGNDQADVDGIAADIAQHVFAEFRQYAPWRGGRFLPSVIMFTTYAGEGTRVGATPDGRMANEPLADSVGPIQGRDTHGPTAMLRSVTRLPLRLAVGTPVLNIRFGRHLFDGGSGRQRIRELITAYFRMGGMQMQVSVVDQAVLRDAMEHPERHGNLIVRIGGFSAHFNSLGSELQRTILERTEHMA